MRIFVHLAVALLLVPGAGSCTRTTELADSEQAAGPDASVDAAEAVACVCATACADNRACLGIDTETCNLGDEHCERMAAEACSSDAPCAIDQQCVQESDRTRSCP